MNSPNPKFRQDRPTHALAWMSVSALAFSIMAIFVKRLSGTVPQFEIVFFRSLVNLLLLFPVVLIRGESLYPRRGKRILIVRGVAGFVAVVSTFYAISMLPLTIAVLLNWSSPVFVIAFSWVLLGERTRRETLIWAMAAFVGLVLLLNPDFTASRWTSLSLGGVAAGIFGAAAAGLAYVAVRAATAQVGVNTIVVYFVGIATLLSAPLALRNFLVPDFIQGTQLILMGLCATLGQVTMTHAYRFAPAGLVSGLGLLNAAFSAVFGWLLFDDRLAAIQWAGMGLLAFGVAALALTGARGKP